MTQETDPPWFYWPGLDEDLLRITGDEAHHMRTTRRLGPGDTVTLFDGAGRRVTGKIVRADRRAVEVVVHNRHAESARSGRLTLAVALPKGKRQDGLFEKLTELGAEAIWPMITQRSVVRPDADRTIKWRRSAIEAAKQSHQMFLPGILPPQSYAEVVRQADGFDCVLLASPTPDAAPINALLSALAPSDSVLALVGPEGGFSPKEYNAALAVGARPVRLAPGVLRIETAAIAVAAIYAATLPT